MASRANPTATIVSKPGRGTSVRLYQPRHQKAGAGKPSSAAVSAERASTGETVLVVEDEPVVRGVIREMLGEHGYRTFEAGDAGGSADPAHRPADRSLGDRRRTARHGWPPA